MCTFGDRCNYAHGEGELRALPPEGYEILEKREQRRMRQEVRGPCCTRRARCSAAGSPCWTCLNMTGLGPCGASSHKCLRLERD